MKQHTFRKTPKPASDQSDTADPQPEAPKEPTAQESLNVLNELVGRLALSRNDHLAVLNHIENIRKALPAQS